MKSKKQKDMMNELEQTISRVNNLSVTENGAVGLVASGNIITDLNFKVSGRHGNVSDETIHMFERSLVSDPVYTIKWLFFLRDVREGLGERDSFLKLFIHLYESHPDIAMKVIRLIPEYGRWKDIIDIFSNTKKDTYLYDYIIDIVYMQIKEDMCNCSMKGPVSLLAKWMPSVNASKKARRIALEFCDAFEIYPDVYRKTLSRLRKYIDVTEVKTCGGKWNQIDYNRVSSNANARYNNAFMKHDPERRNEYLDKIMSGVKCGAVMHAGVLYPYDVYRKYSEADSCFGFGKLSGNVKYDEGVEALWKNLKDIETMGNTIVVVDGSSSMLHGNSNIRPIDVSRSLGVFFSERCTGEYKDKVIEFSSTPKYIDLSGCSSLVEKYNKMCKYHDYSNTDIEMTFDLILKTATENNLSQDEIPERVLVISDMEFDSMHGEEHSIAMSRYKTLFENIKSRWESFGYRMPELCFWNVNSRTNLIPISQNECGVKLVSGMSVNAVKTVLTGKTDPWESLKEALDSGRYDKIEEALK